MNEALRRELLRMQQADLDLRARLARDGSLFGGYAEPMASLHRRHNARLREILSAHGWPGRTLVGDDGMSATWLLLQHAVLDPALMRSALPMLERAVQSDEIESEYLAYLTDRIRSLEGRPQIYGTQHDWDAAGRLSPLPIEEPAQVDERRRSVGLEPIAKATAQLRARAEAEGEQAPTDHDAHQRAAEEWARSVGWRT